MSYHDFLAQDREYQRGEGLPPQTAAVPARQDAAPEKEETHERKMMDVMMDVEDVRRRATLPNPNTATDNLRSNPYEIYPDLLPCPFCGKTPELENLVDEDDYGVECGCGIQQICNYTRSEAIRRWNSRSTLGAQTAVGEGELPELVPLWHPEITCAHYWVWLVDAHIDRLKAQLREAIAQRDEARKLLEEKRAKFRAVLTRYSDGWAHEQDCTDALIDEYTKLQAKLSAGFKAEELERLFEEEWESGAIAGVLSAFLMRNDPPEYYKAVAHIAWNMARLRSLPSEPQDGNREGVEKA